VLADDKVVDGIEFVVEGGEGLVNGVDVGGEVIGVDMVAESGKVVVVDGVWSAVAVGTVVESLRLVKFEGDAVTVVPDAVDVEVDVTDNGTVDSFRGVFAFLGIGKVLVLTTGVVESKSGLPVLASKGISVDTSRVPSVLCSAGNVVCSSKVKVGISG